MIRLTDVNKVYRTSSGPVHVLRDVNLTVAAGDRVGILGRNGAGKSTMIRLVSGAELPTTGQVERRMSVSWPLAFGGAFQGSLTGYDNVRFICRIYGVDPAEGRIVASAVLPANPYRSRIAIGPTGLWLSNGRGAVLKLDPVTARVVMKIRLPAAPAAIAADGHSLWTIDGSGVLWRIDPSDGRVRSRTKLAPTGDLRPVDLQVAGDKIWASFGHTAAAAAGYTRPTVRVGQMRATPIPVSGIPTRLRDIGVTEDMLLGFAEKAFAIKRLMRTNPRMPESADEILAIYRAAF